MNDRTNLLQIDDDRLWDTMMASARIGPGRDQGLRRLALDASDKEMRDLFVAWCRRRGRVRDRRQDGQHLRPSRRP